MTEKRTYRVGDHIFSIESPKELLSEKELSQYAPFQTDSSFPNACLFKLNLLPTPHLLPTPDITPIHLVDENGTMDIYQSSLILTSPKGNEVCRMLISVDFKNADAWIGGTRAERRFALDTALMLMYTFASAPLQTLLIHASAIEYNGLGYTFLGKSSTGKSTHSRLWLENIPGSTLLNDDNPIIRIIDGQAYVYGSPWSGKTPCYKNRRLPLAGIVRLHQAQQNRMTPLSGIKAYAALLPSCSSMKWNISMATSLHTTIAKVIEIIPVFSLECLPDRHAALICSKTLINDNAVGTHGPCVRVPEELP